MITCENFHKFVKATDMDTWLMLEKNALSKQLNLLNIMEAKCIMEEVRLLQKVDYPNKYLDVELGHMKEIRDTYFYTEKD